VRVLDVQFQIQLTYIVVGLANKTAQRCGRLRWRARSRKASRAECRSWWRERWPQKTAYSPCAPVLAVTALFLPLLPKKGAFRLKIIVEIIGWTAAVMMLSAYVLLTTGRLRSLSPTYQWLNVLSGAGFIVNSGWNGAYPSAFLNLIWMAIGLYGLFRGARVQPKQAA